MGYTMYENDIRLIISIYTYNLPISGEGSYEN